MNIFETVFQVIPIIAKTKMTFVGYYYTPQSILAILSIDFHKKMFYNEHITGGGKDVNAQFLWKIAFYISLCPLFLEAAIEV